MNFCAVQPYLIGIIFLPLLIPFAIWAYHAPCALSFVYHFISYNCPTFIYLRASTLSLLLLLLSAAPLPSAPPATASLCQPFSDYITQLLMASLSSVALLPVSCHFQHFLNVFSSHPPPLASPWRGDFVTCGVRQMWSMSKCGKRCARAYTCLYRVRLLFAFPSATVSGPRSTHTWCPSSFTSWSGGGHSVLVFGEYVVWQRQLPHKLPTVMFSLTLRLGNLLMSFSVTPLLIRPARQFYMHWLESSMNFGTPKSHCTDPGTMHKACDAGLK